MIFAQVQLARNQEEGENFCYFNYEFGVLRKKPNYYQLNIPEDPTGRETGDRGWLGVEKEEVKVILKLKKKLQDD